MSRLLTSHSVRTGEYCARSLFTCLWTCKYLSKNANKYETAVVERLKGALVTHANSVVSRELVRLLTIIESDRCPRTYKVLSEARFLKILGGICCSLFDSKFLLNRTEKSRTKHMERPLKPDFPVPPFLSPLDPHALE